MYKLYYILATLVGAQASLCALPDLFPVSEKMIPKEEPSSSYTYITIGAALPIPVPNLQVGRREKFDNSAVDVSLGLSTAVVASNISGNCSYLKYVNNGKYYLGAGASIDLAVLIWEPYVNYGITPNLYIGKESEKRFHQIKATLVSFTCTGTGIYPWVAYQYGFKF